MSERARERERKFKKKCSHSVVAMLRESSLPKLPTKTESEMLQSSSFQTFFVNVFFSFIFMLSSHQLMKNYFLRVKKSNNLNSSLAGAFALFIFGASILLFFSPLVLCVSEGKKSVCNNSN